MIRHKFPYPLIAVALAALLAASCAQSYVFAENEYLLNKNKIVITNSSTYPKSELAAYLKQTEKANQNMGLRWMFAKPVLLDDDLIAPSCRGMLRHLEYQGYYNSRIDTAVVQGHGKVSCNPRQAIPGKGHHLCLC